MQVYIYIRGTDIQYTLDKNKRKNSYIQIKEGKVIVKVPKNSSEKYINDLLQEKIKWIKDNLNKYNNSARNIKYEDGSIIPLLGKKYILEINFSDDIKKYKLYNNNSKILLIFPSKYKNLSNTELIVYIKKVLDKYFKDIANEEVSAAMDYITNKVGLYPKEINIKKLKATWGICSSKKCISINQNLMMFSRRAIEYVCLHEICHLKYMNHSKEFWNMVCKYMPEYKDAKKKLKD